MEFEQMLNQYNIEISERTRRLIRRNNEKNARLVEKQQAKKVCLFARFLYLLWVGLYTVLSIIMKITLRIMMVILWVCIYIAKLVMELYFCFLIVHVTRVVMKQLQAN